MKNKSANAPEMHGLPDELRLMQHCPLCKYKYETNDIFVVEEREETRLAHITCGQCKNAVLAVIVMSRFGVSSVGVVTDLCPEDVIRARNRLSISQDDVLSFYSLLERVNIFEKLITPKR